MAASCTTCNNEVEQVAITASAPYVSATHVKNNMKATTTSTSKDIPPHYHWARVDENKNRKTEGGRERDDESDFVVKQHPQQRYAILRCNLDQSNQNRRNSHDQPPPTGLSPSDEERYRSCVVLIASWAFLLISIMFLICYLYQLEWSPETADPIHVFSLDLAVNMLYLMFTVDIFASIGIIISYKEHVKPFRLRVYWPAVVFLILNQIHGTLIWLWVWTGEFPRICARNSFYSGRRCENLAFILTWSPGEPLRPSDCKCDYGSCLPECKGLRLLQNYFWGTYWLSSIRLALLIILIPWLNRTICQCKCCCCIDPRDLPLVGPSDRGTEIAIAITDEGYNDTTEHRRVTNCSRSLADDSRDNKGHCHDHCGHQQHDCNHKCGQSHHRVKKDPPPCCQDEAEQTITELWKNGDDPSGPCASIIGQPVGVEQEDKSRHSKICAATSTCCSRQNQNQPSSDPVLPQQQSQPTDKQPEPTIYKDQLNQTDCESPARIILPQPSKCKPHREKRQNRDCDCDLKNLTKSESCRMT